MPLVKLVRLDLSDTESIELCKTDNGRPPHGEGLTPVKGSAVWARVCGDLEWRKVNGFRYCGPAMDAVLRFDTARAAVDHLCG